MKSKICDIFLSLSINSGVFGYYTQSHPTQQDIREALLKHLLKISELVKKSSSYGYALRFLAESFTQSIFSLIHQLNISFLNEFVVFGRISDHQVDQEIFFDFIISKVDINKNIQCSEKVHNQEDFFLKQIQALKFKAQCTDYQRILTKKENFILITFRNCFPPLQLEHAQFYCE